jgi:hypothetical protein
MRGGAGMAVNTAGSGVLPDTATLEAMKEQSHGEIDKNILVDIQDVSINPDLPLVDRMTSFIHQIKNPYVFRYKSRVVRVSYADTETTFEERMKNYFEML